MPFPQMDEPRHTKFALLGISIGVFLITALVFLFFKQQVVQGELNKLKPSPAAPMVVSGSLKDTSKLFETHCYGTGNTGSCITTHKATGNVVMQVHEDFALDAGFQGDKNKESRKLIMDKYLSGMKWTAAHMQCSSFIQYGAGDAEMPIAYALDKNQKERCALEYMGSN